MEDDAERRAPSRGQRADPVAHSGTIKAAAAPDGALTRGEDQERASPQLLDVGAALRPRTLLEQYKLTAFEVASRTIEHGDYLEQIGRAHV